MGEKTLFHYAFNARDAEIKIQIGIDEHGNTLVYFPGVTVPWRITRDRPIDIGIGGYGQGRADSVILVEASFL